MNTQIILATFCQFETVVSIFSLIAGVLALVISFGFLFRPRVKCKIFITDVDDDKKEQIHVKLLNCNKFRKLLTDISCEILVSDDFRNTVKTLELRKSNIVYLLRTLGEEDYPNYTFITKNFNDYNNRKFMKVRFLVPNFLGIKKGYEYMTTISEIKEGGSLLIPFKKPTYK